MIFWKKDGETVEIYERGPQDFVAWNRTRGNMAVEPPLSLAWGQESKGFPDVESVEAALEEDGWVRA